MKLVENKKISQKLFILFILFCVLIKFSLSLGKRDAIDMGGYLAWSRHLAEKGFSDFYETWHVVYPPAYMYLLWISGKIASLFDFPLKFHEVLIKFWSILAEIIGAYLIFQIGKRQKREKLGIFLALAYAFNPAVFFNSSFWGQFDSLVATLMFASVYFFDIKKPLWGIGTFIVSCLVKQQSLILAPVLAILFLREFSWKKFFLAILLVLNIYFLIVLPFSSGRSIWWVFPHTLKMAGDYPYATVNAFNFWMLVGGQTTHDKESFFGLSYFLWGIIFILIIESIACFLIWRKREDPFWLYFSCLFVCYGFFIFGTRMHERYLLPAFIFFTLILLWERKFWLSLLIASLCHFGNTFYVYWRGWYGATHNDPFFVWVPQKDQIAFWISLFTLLVFFFVGYFIILQLLKELKQIKIKTPFIKFQTISNFQNKLPKKEIVFLFILFLLSFSVHFIFFGHPKEVVFDEVHYGKAINGYIKGEYFFTGHPPLAAQLMALVGYLGKYKGEFPFEEIGEKFTNSSYLSLRFLPSLLGAFLPILIYFFLKILSFSPKLAIFASLFLVFENAILAQSRFILVDIFLIFFGFLGLTLFFYSRSKNYKFSLLLLSACFFGMSAAVKWSGLGFLLFAALISVIDLIKTFLGKDLKEALSFALKISLTLIVFAFLTYFFSFYLHFKFLFKPGPGDVFMSQEFLRGEKNLWEKFVELNKTNYYSNIKLEASHPYESKFYTWPLMLRPIFYWTNDNSRIYLIGNPINWYFSTFSILFGVIFLFFKKFQDRNLSFLLLGYFANFIPYLSVTRATFLYHYFPSYIFAISIMVYLLSKLKKPWIVLLLVAAFLAFLYFAPLTYGLKLSPEQYQNRLWLKSWL